MSGLQHCLIAKTMGVKIVDHLFVVVLGTADPTDDEWAAYLAEVDRLGIEHTAQLIATDGGQPTAPQRARLNELLGGRLVPVAVVSPSARVRGTVALLSLLNPRIRAFPPSGLSEALVYLHVPLVRFEHVRRELAVLRRQLGDEAWSLREVAR